MLGLQEIEASVYVLKRSTMQSRAKCGEVDVV
jgi:hypothetical protein